MNMPTAVGRYGGEEFVAVLPSADLAHALGISGCAQPWLLTR